MNITNRLPTFEDICNTTYNSMHKAKEHVVNTATANPRLTVAVVGGTAAVIAPAPVLIGLCGALLSAKTAKNLDI